MTNTGKPAALDDILSALTKVFREVGYEGATLTRMTQATGLKRASLYYYFPKGKEEMALAVVQRSNKIFDETILAPLRGPRSPQEKIETMITNLDAYYGKGEESCLLGVLALGEKTNLFQDHIREGLGGWIREVARVLVESGLPEHEARQKAEDAVLIIEGGLIVGRGIGETGPFQRVLAQLREQLCPPNKHDASVNSSNQQSKKRGL